MTIQEIEQRLISVEQSVIELQRSRYPMVSKVDDTSNRVTAITPYTETKTAYIGDTEITFENVPQGNLSVFGISEYSIDRQSDRITIMFDAVEEVTDITISIQ